MKSIDSYANSQAMLNYLTGMSFGAKLTKETKELIAEGRPLWTSELSKMNPPPDAY